MSVGVAWLIGWNVAALVQIVMEVSPVGGGKPTQIVLNIFKEAGLVLIDRQGRGGVTVKHDYLSIADARLSHERSHLRG
jgi:hypothetical protein